MAASDYEQHSYYGQQFVRGRFFNFPMEKELAQADSPRGRQTADRLTLNPYSPLPPISRPETSDEETSMSPAVNELYSRLPAMGNRLTQAPLQLPREDEQLVMHELLKELRYLDPTKLKQVYMELTNYDEDLSGLCLFDDLQKAFAKNNISLPNQLLRLVASMFVNSAEPHKINYERILSFVGASLRAAGHDGSYQLVNSSQYESSSSPRTSYQRSFRQPQQLPALSEQHPVYYQQEEQPLHNPGSSRSTPGAQRASGGVLTDRDLPRVLRQLEEELATVDRPVNFETLRLAFQRADRLLRGTLSREQLKQMLWDFRIRLREPVLDNVISLCRHRGGGQYDWEQFLQFLERMTPQNTGLRIPSSKKPIEFAKHYPQPSSSWPHADSKQQQYQQQQQQQYQQQYQQQQSLASPPPLPPPPPPLPPQQPPPQPLYRNQTPQRQQQQQQQQPQYPVAFSQRDMPPAPAPLPPLPSGRSITEPWFSRFMKLADALYRHDNDSRGFLSEDEVRRLVQRYNHDYELSLDPTSVQAALNATRASSGRVDINAFLKRLAVRVN